MRFKILAAVAMVACAFAALTGCQARPGAAAIVLDHRIGEKSVTANVSGSGQATKAQSAAIVLTLLIQERLLQDRLAAHGGMPSAGDLTARHDAALPQALKTLQLTGDAADETLRTQLAESGIVASFLSHVLRVIEMNQVFAERQIATAELTGAKVSVSPRYGRWNAAQLLVQGSPQPDFLIAPRSSGGA